MRYSAQVIYDIMQDKIASNFAKGLKGLRTSLGWSLQKTAEKTGISKSMLGQIERCESMPTIITLWKLASGFHLSFSEMVNLLYLEEENPASTIKPVVGEKSFLAKTLLPYDEKTRSEIFEVTMDARVKHLSPTHNRGVVEHIILVQGVLSVLDERCWHPLTAGSCYVLNGHQEHGYYNPSKQRTVFHLIMHYLENSR